jgi:hypothetical protein
MSLALAAYLLVAIVLQKHFGFTRAEYVVCVPNITHQRLWNRVVLATNRMRNFEEHASNFNPPRGSDSGLFPSYGGARQSKHAR